MGFMIRTNRFAWMPILLVLWISAITRSSALDGNITTIAGSSASGHAGDGGPAINATFTYSSVFPNALAVDPNGNLYIADSDRIRKIDTSGTITTIAGNGYYRPSTYPMAASQSLLGAPYAITIGPSNSYGSTGELYIADAQYNQILKYSLSTNQISVVVGDGNTGGSFYGDGGLAINAGISLISYHGSMGFDGYGRLYFSDAMHARIRRVDELGYISTVCGNGSSFFSGPCHPLSTGFNCSFSLATFPASMSCYIAGWDPRILRMTTYPDAYPSYNTISVYAGTQSGQGSTGDGGQALSAHLNLGYADPVLATDSSGNLYLAEFGRIRKISATTGIITSIAGTGAQGYSGDNGPALSATIGSITGMAVDRKSTRLNSSHVAA